MDKSGISHIARTLRGEAATGQPSLARGFRLGSWRVRPDLCTLQAVDKCIQLEPKTMGVLLCLAQHAPQVVTRDQFIEEVWNGRIVTDEVLSRAISLLRSELGDDAQNPCFVRTVPRVGYALMAPVEPLEPVARVDQSPRAAPPSGLRTRSQTWRWAVAGAGAAVVVAFAGWWWAQRHAAPESGTVRLAVLPLASIGSEAGDPGLADGLTDELTVSLSRIKGLRVVARDSALRFRSGDADLVEVAETLGATHIVTGSVRASTGRLRVNVHLADSATGTEIWAESYDRGFGDLFGVQADISAAVAQALRQRLSPVGEAGTSATFVERPPANPEAYRYYLQGRQQLARRGEEGLRSAITLLERAITADPGFLRAHFALAWACTLLANSAPAEAEVLVARADRALAFVARETAMSGEIHAIRAWLALERNHWIEAEEAFRAALAATPDDTEIRLRYSQMQGALGRREDADQTARQALASDPLAPTVYLRLAVLKLWADEEREAASLLSKARELDLAPSALPELPMLLYVRGGELERLETALREVQKLRRQADAWVPVVVSAIGERATGEAAEAAMESAARSGQIDGLLHFGALVLAGRNERALQWLLGRERLRTGELEFTLASREAADLRRLPEFGQVITRFGLDAYWDRFGWPEQCGRTAEAIRCR